MRKPPAKTYKTECAFGLLGLLVFITLKVFLFPGTDVAMVNALQSYYGNFAMFVTTFAGAMLGLDAWAKQIIPAQQATPTPPPPAPPPPVKPPVRVAVPAGG